jgi:hypothetical protein
VNEKIKTAMSQLAEALKEKPQNQFRVDKLQKELDDLLGTALKKQDDEGAEAWERSRR